MFMEKVLKQRFKTHESVSQIDVLKSFYRMKGFLEFLNLHNVLCFLESWCFLFTHIRKFFKRFAINLTISLKTYNSRQTLRGTCDASYVAKVRI